MEYTSQNDVVNDVADIIKSGSELDINLDEVISNKDSDTKNETDIFSNLITAIEESLSGLSVSTAMTEETEEQSLNAYADPSLNTRISFSTASELSNKEQEKLQENEQCWNNPFPLNQFPLKVWRNERGISRYEMICDEKRLTVVDSLECLTRLQSDPPLEPVYFDPRVYLGVPYCEDNFTDLDPTNSIIDSDSVLTAELGPTSVEFEDWIRKLEEKEYN